jgi:hypothetical protein
MAEAAVAGIELPRSRPFTLGDAMIVIIALALGLAIARPGIGLVVDSIRSDPKYPFRTWAGAVSLGRILNLLLLNFLVILQPAFLILRLRRPRAPLRSLIGQPGFAACAAPIAIFLAILPFELLPTGIARQVMEIAAQVLIVAAVPLAWVYLLVTRRWAPEPSWIDRAGRVLGAIWMICIPAHMVLIRQPY